MAPRLQQRPDLCTQDVRLIETDTDGAPTEERIRLGCRVNGHRKLVATKVIAANDDRISSKPLCHTTEERNLLLFTGKLRPPQNQELGAQKPNSFRAMPRSSIEFFRQVEVAPQGNCDFIGRDVGLLNSIAELHIQRQPPPVHFLCLRDVVRSRLEKHPPVGSIYQDLHTVRHTIKPSDQPHDPRYAKAACEDGRVCCPRPFFARESCDLFSLELHDQPCGQLAREHNYRMIVGRLQHAVHGLAREMTQDSYLDSGQVGNPLAQQRARRLCPQCTHLQGLEFKGALGTQLIVGDQVLNFSKELGILDHQDLSVEDLCFLWTSTLSGTLSEVLEQFPDGSYGPVQAHDLSVHLVPLNGTQRYPR